MNHQRHQVVIGGVDDHQARRLVLQLVPFGMDFVRVPWMSRVVSVASRTEFDAVVILCPEDPSVLRDMVDGIRAPSSLSRWAAVVLLGSEEQLKWARGYVGGLIDRAVSLSDPEEVWRDAVLEVLEVATRFHLRTPVEVTADSPSGPVTAAGHTVNVSTSGMLVTCDSGIPVGSALQFALSVPGEDDPIRGEARVARRTDPQREGVEAIGAWFVSFLDSDRSRLRRVLSRQAG